MSWDIDRLTFLPPTASGELVEITMSNGSETRLVVVSREEFRNRRAFWTRAAEQARIQWVTHANPPGDESEFDAAWEELADSYLRRSTERN